MTNLESKLRIYYITVIFSVIFAIIGFSYNAWRLESSEENNNIRTAAFQVLNELAELEQIIYAAHYDQDKVAGSPRKAWVKIGLIVDLSVLIDPSVEKKTKALHMSWAASWESIASDKSVVDVVIVNIEQVREQVKHTLYSLE